MNCILIMCDTWRRDWIGAYGADWIRTPNTDKLAEKATVFDNFYCGSFPTLPCRNDIATGRYEFPWRSWGGLDPEIPTLAGHVVDSGRLAYFLTDVYHHWGRDAGNYWRDFTGFDLIRGQERDGYITDTDCEPDLDAIKVRETEPIMPHLRNTKFIRRNEEDWFAPQVFTRAGRWIQHNAGHQDFFLMIDCFDPHEPWDPPRHYVDMYDDPSYDGLDYVTALYREVDGYMTEAEFRHNQALYAGQITMVDRWLGRFLDQIEAMGLMDDTVVILTTDHGTYCGDHGYTGKLSSHMFQSVSRIPAIVWHPEAGHGERREQLGQPVDWFPTVLEAVGAEIPDNIHGKSLLPVVADAKAPLRDTALFGRFIYECNLTDGKKVLYQCPDEHNHPLYNYSIVRSKWASPDWGDFDGVRRMVDPDEARKGTKHQTALFDLVADPNEENDLSKSDMAELLKMQQLLIARLREIGAPTEFLTRLGLDSVAS